MAIKSNNNQPVRDYWEKQPCGTGKEIVEDVPPGSKEWFERVEEKRYILEPFIHSAVQFTRHHGKRILEVGVGAGTDHLQWVRAGAQCSGVDLTQAAIDTTQARFALYNFKSNLTRIDAEKLPFPNETFDVVYSWGVIHHSEKPSLIIEEIHRVLKPGGRFIGMLYGTRSLVVAKLWIRYGLLKGRPFRNAATLVANHMESPGTKAYTVREVQNLFASFSTVDAKKVLTPYDTSHLPQWLTSWLPARLGWFIVIQADKRS